MRRCCLALALVSLTWSGELFAQRLEGKVFDSESGRPIAGAIVSALASAGDMLSSTATNERGEYVVDLSTQPASIRIVRIGFRPATRALAQGTNRLDIGMSRLPTLLEPVAVAANEKCPRSWTSRDAFGLLEQIRAALLNIKVSQRQPGLVRLGYERNSYMDSIYSQSVHVDSTARADGSYALDLAPSTLLVGGFVGMRGSDTVLYSPDGTLLMSPEFAEVYCFRTTASGKDQRLVGLRFQRPDRQFRRVDVSGTLWVDTVARELHSMEYEFVGLPSVARAVNPGGQVRFRQVSTGSVIIERWSIVVAALRATACPRRPLYEVHETGGEVAALRGADGESVEMPLGGLEVDVVSRSNSPMKDLPMHLLGTDYRGVTDSLGHVSFKHLLPGPYRLAVHDSAFLKAGIDLSVGFSFIAARDSVVRGRARGFTPREFAHDRCLKDNAWTRLASTADSARWIVGRAVDVDGRAIAGVTVAVRQAGDVVARSQPTSADGVFQLCPPDLGTRPIELIATHARFGRVAIVLDSAKRLVVAPVRFPVAVGDRAKDCP